MAASLFQQLLLTKLNYHLRSISVSKRYDIHLFLTFGGPRVAFRALLEISRLRSPASTCSVSTRFTHSCTARSGHGWAPLSPLPPNINWGTGQNELLWVPPTLHHRPCDITAYRGSDWLPLRDQSLGTNIQTVQGAILYS